MRLPDCRFRRPLNGQPNACHHCAHPKVRTRGNRVTAEICNACGFRNEATNRFTDSLIPPPRLEWHFTRPQSVAVVIPCRNYGRYLRECLHSVLAQTYQASDILVVDDGSTDDTRLVAESFAEKGVRYLRVNLHNSQQARRAGLEATVSDVLCFVDADDRLAPDYLQEGMAEFRDLRVGVVYSDVQDFGYRSRRTAYPASYSLAQLERKNILHAGCLVLREALEISRALSQVAVDREGLPDWLLWRRVLRAGWTARKQSGIYFYRRHSRSMSNRRRRTADGFYERGSLDKEVVTLFVPLSGRVALWPRLAAYLERQRWPHDQTRLVLMDTSQNPEFSESIRRWLAGCDYTDVRHLREAVAEPGLADRPRYERKQEVSLAMARIYNLMRREPTTEYIWVVEDDMLPPDNACERLLKRFDSWTASVSAAYWSRFAKGYVAWDYDQRRLRREGVGVQLVGGNGFGCVILRRSVLQETLFTATLDIPAYDNAFYHRLATTGLQAKIDWSVRCDHSS